MIVTFVRFVIFSPMCAKDDVEDEKADGQTNPCSTDNGHDGIGKNGDALISFKTFDIIDWWSKS
jgi:hypothetical protein